MNINYKLKRWLTVVLAVQLSAAERSGEFLVTTGGVCLLHIAGGQCSGTEAGAGVTVAWRVDGIAGE